LLRVIQEKTVRAIGAANEIPIDVRILSATHKNLAKLVEEGRFRHDLYYRINVIELPVPPLRERREDIAVIAAAVLKVVNVYQAEVASPTNIGTGWGDVGLSQAVTPQATTSKFFVIATIGAACQTGGCGSSGEHAFRLLRDATELDRKIYDEGGAEGRSSMAPCAFIYRDSPATVSAITYKVQGIAASAGIYAAPGNASTIAVQSKAVLIIIEYRDT
jgi:hypothetical protein